MEKKIKVSCPAKINLSLDVKNKRSDGYHELKMIMQAVNIFDYVETELDDTGVIKLYSGNPAVPLDESNTAYKAAKKFFEYSKKVSGVRIVLSKNIPIGAGMAGGSTDAAGVLKGLNILFKNQFSDKELEKIGKGIGADVPFFIKGGCQLCEGIGEILTPLPKITNVYLTVAKPNFMVSTPWVYKNLALDGKNVHPDTDLLIKALYSGDYEAFENSSGNTLEAVTSAKYPEIEEYKRIMIKNGAFFSMMTGSGPTVFGLFKDKEKAAFAAEIFKQKTKEVFMVKM